MFEDYMYDFIKRVCDEVGPRESGTEEEILAGNMIEEEFKKYCDEEGLFIEQQERWSQCDNHFECKSNICVENECISRGVMQAIMDFLQRLFGRSYNNADDVVEAI